MESSHQHRFPEDVPVHGLQHVGAGRVRREIQLGIEREQLPRVVMVRDARRIGARVLVGDDAAVFECGGRERQAGALCGAGRGCCPGAAGAGACAASGLIPANIANAPAIKMFRVIVVSLLFLLSFSRARAHARRELDSSRYNPPRSRVRSGDRPFRSASSSRRRPGL